MIIRVSNMRAVSKSSIGRAVKYLTDNQGKAQRVGHTLTLNCRTQDLNQSLLEIESLQTRKQNVRGDKTLHLIVSFTQNDQLTQKNISEISQKIVQSLGYENHQCIVVEHRDTDHPHFHILVNKISPTNLKMVEHFRAYKKLAEVAMQIEKDYGFTITNHQTKQTAGASNAKNMEAHQGQESFIGFLRNELNDKISTVETWDQFHAMLAALNVSIKPRGNGFVFENADGLQVKASSVNRVFSKASLEKILGQFEGSRYQTVGQSIYNAKPLYKEIKGNLYDLYLSEKVNRKSTLNEKFQRLKLVQKQKYENIRNNARAAKAFNRILIKDRENRKVANAVINESARQQREAVREEISREREKLFKQYGSQSWVDFLRARANAGDLNSLFVLRHRPGGDKDVGGNSVSTVETSQQVHGLLNLELPKDSLTKRGTVIYSDGITGLKDSGSALQISDQFNEKLVKETLMLAQKRYGNKVRITGSEDFKASVLIVAVTNKMDLEFLDPEMERCRQQLNLEINGVIDDQRTRNERRSIGHNDGNIGRDGGQFSGRRILYAGAEGRREDSFAQKIREAFVRNWRSGLSATTFNVGTRSRSQTVATRRGGFDTGRVALSSLSLRNVGQIQERGTNESGVHLRLGRRHGQADHIRLNGAERFGINERRRLWGSNQAFDRTDGQISQTFNNRLCNAYIRENGHENHYRFNPQGVDEATYEGLTEFQGQNMVMLRTAQKAGIGICPLEELGWSESRLEAIGRGNRLNLKPRTQEKIRRKR